MQTIPSSQGKEIVLELVETVRENAGYLSEIDGAIGDGDHGINMNKGFLRARGLLEDKELDLSGSLDTLGQVLFTEIGGAMGPLYGTFFMEMAQACQGEEEIGIAVFGQMLSAAYAGVVDVGGAQVGDKTMVDVLAPAQAAFRNAEEQDLSFRQALEAMRQAAEDGQESTRQLVAKLGRASRLGERSRGVLDAGAVSCCLILCSLADSIIPELDN